MLALESNAVYAGPVARVSVYRLFHVEDDAVSALSELTEISEPRVATNNEHSDEESEAEVSSIPRILHRLTLAPPRFHSSRFID